MIVECEVLEGLADIAGDEVRRRLGPTVADMATAPTSVRFRYGGRLADVLDVRTVVAVWSALGHPVPRPKGLLGHQHLQKLLAQVDQARSLGSFIGVRLNAAGRHSAVMRRLVDELVHHTGLPHDREGGDLVVRIRPGADGWETLVRLTPRPLSARAWRVRNLPGALNATIAAAMVELSSPRAGDGVLNLMCGSGTLLIERLLRADAASAAGVDIDETALDGAAANVAAAGLAGRVDLRPGDATHLDLADASVDRLFADLPYGHRMGTHQDNEALYPAVLAEAARVATADAVFVVVTHELRRFEAAVRDSRWRVESVRQVFQKGHHPKIWVLSST